MENQCYYFEGDNQDPIVGYFIVDATQAAAANHVSDLRPIPRFVTTLPRDVARSMRIDLHVAGISRVWRPPSIAQQESN